MVLEGSQEPSQAPRTAAGPRMLLAEEDVEEARQHQRYRRSSQGRSWDRTNLHSTAEPVSEPANEGERQVKRPQVETKNP